MTRFDNLFSKKQQDEPVDESVADEQNPKPASPSPQPTSEQERSPRKRRGKRNDPAYTQVTAYIRKETHHQVKLALLQEGGDREFSELVEDLLSEYLRTQISDNSKT